MIRTPNLRTDAGLVLATAGLVLLALLLSGCSDDDGTVAAALPQPPALPAGEQFEFDFSDLDAAADLAKADGLYDNFTNAYLRAVVLDAMARLTLAAPVGAFGAAAGTVPVQLEDGAWLWTYYWQGAPDPVRIELRGRVDGGMVAWELKLVPANGTGLVWFSGTTGDHGREAAWTFYDLDRPGTPVSGGVRWGAADGGRFLEFTSHAPDSDGDVLRFASGPSASRIDFTPGDGGPAGFIRWDATGAGSLRVPDYNGGLEACWDVWFRNLDCD